MLEVFELRKASSALRQELSHALYKEDAAMRVLARTMRERDEARAALASVRQSMGLGAESSTSGAASGDVEMEGAQVEAASGLPAPVVAVIDGTFKR